MILNEDTLKRIFQENIYSHIVASRNGCPSFSTLSCSFSPRSSRRTNKKIADHIAHCPACFEEFNFLIQLAGKENELAAKASEWVASRKKAYAAKRPIPLFYEYASVSMVILLLFTSFFFILSSFYFPSVRGVPIQYIGTISPVGRTPVVSSLNFKWKGIKEPIVFTLELYDDSLRLIWKAEDISSTSITGSTELFASLKEDSTYYWIVLGNSKDQHLYHSYLQAFAIIHRPE